MERIVINEVNIIPTGEWDAWTLTVDGAGNHIHIKLEHVNDLRDAIEMLIRQVNRDLVR